MAVRLQAGDDVVILKDGSSLSGMVVELGGNRIDLALKSSSKRLFKRDILKVTFDESRPLKTVESTDVVVKKGGHIVRGKVELLDGGQKVQVTLPGGGKATFQRQDLARIIRSGEAVEQDTTVYTAELGKAIGEALEKIRGGSDPNAESEKLLASCGILAIERVRDALVAAPRGSIAEKALSRVDFLYRLKEAVASDLEETEPRTYEILSSGSTEDKCSLLLFALPRYVEGCVPLAELLAKESSENPTVRAWSIDFLRRMQRNRELVGIYKKTTGSTQLASAIALGQNRILIGMPALIEALELDSLEIRALASKELHELTGEDFQFRPDGAPQARKEAVARWRAWWQKSEDSITKVSQNLLRTGTDDAALVGSPTPERLDAIKLWTAAGQAVDAKRFTEAEKLLRQALDRDNTFFQGHIALAVVLYSYLGKADEAARLLRDLTTKRLPGVTATDRQWVFVHLGNSLRLKGDLDGAIHAYQEARSLAPQNLQALIGLVDAAFRRATAGDELKPEDRKEMLGIALDTAKLALKAIDSLSEDLVTMRAENVPLAGEAPFDRREYNRSILSIRKMYRREKKEVAFEAAKVLALQGDKKEAILTLRSVSEEVLHDADDATKKLEADLRCYMGVLYEDLGQPLVALREFRKVLRDFAPEHAESLRGVERLRKYAAQDRPGN